MKTIYTILSLFNILEVELQKLERRIWLPPWKIMKLEEGKLPTCLDLPVPSSHPSLLNRQPDFGAKVHFLSGLGLKTVSDRGREGKKYILISKEKYQLHIFLLQIGNPRGRK